MGFTKPIGKVREEKVKFVSGKNQNQEKLKKSQTKIYVSRREVNGRFHNICQYTYTGESKYVLHIHPLLASVF